MPMLNGAELSPCAKREALASFVHRFTRQHRPTWASGRPDGSPYPVQFASDADWLAHTDFHVTKAGKLHARRACFSRPTWPDNPELRRLGVPGASLTETAA